MKCDKCPGPAPGDYTHLFCVTCAELLAKIYLMWETSGFMNTMSFKEFFSRMHPDV